MGITEDVMICRTGPKEVAVSGEIIVNGKSVTTYMDEIESLKKIVAQIQKQLAG